MSKSSSSSGRCVEKDEEISLLQRCFGVDRLCTVYEEDEGFKLLADLSLCMYFGCGNSKDVEVPRVVSVTNSEDCDGSDSISDMCDERRSSTEKGSQFNEEYPERSRKPDPPQGSLDPHKVSLIHPPPPPPKSPPSLIDTASMTLHDECSRITAHYESREALDDSDEENIPPLSTIVIARRCQSKEILSDDLDDVPPIIFGKLAHQVKEPEPEDEFSIEEYPADEYPAVVYSHHKSSRQRRCAYV